MNRAPAAALPLATLLGHAADAVGAVRAGRSLDDALARVPADARPGAQAIAFHALRWLGSAQAARARLVPKPPAAKVDALLLVALALLWPTGEPAPYTDHTLVDQAVAAARARAAATAGFVNAVLRRFVRERQSIVDDLRQHDPVARTNHPRWWIDRLDRDWPGQAETIMAADNRHPPLTLRVNARRGDAQRYLGRLAQAGLGGIATGTHTVVVDPPVPVQRLPGFDDGEVSVQDAAAQRAAPMLIGHGLRPGARVLDACAAPGGKTAHLLELADLDVLAIDRDPRRLERVDDTLRRLGLQAKTKAADAADTATWWDGRPFDAILLDAPCTASGIVRRHPDVRWLRRAEDVEALARTQAGLLDALWPLLAPGGRLLYCTCSLFRAEGQDQIDAFLQRHPAAAVPADPPSPGHLLPLADNRSDRAPPHLVSDGFFYCLIEKT